LTFNVFLLFISKEYFEGVDAEDSVAYLAAFAGGKYHQIK